jgi:hypothetical protein
MFEAWCPSGRNPANGKSVSFRSSRVRKPYSLRANSGHLLANIFKNIVRHEKCSFTHCRSANREVAIATKPREDPMKRQLATGTAAAALLILSQSAQAAPIATIDGSYDTCFYDTPCLTFHNTSPFALNNAQIVLHGYQGLNNGHTAIVALGNLPVGDTTYIWLGPTVAGSLTSYDYDDEWGNSPAGYTNPGCVVGAALCSLVGNFDVTFTASWQNVPGGTPVFSVFSPTTNFTGGFVGWEGLNPSGLSESVYDVHNGTLGGTLAVINIGTPPTVPEPGTLSLLGACLAALGLFRRRKAQ